MKTILIIGDSWGVPHYSPDQHVSHTDHTEHQLRQKGYNVLNYSLNGSSLIETIEYARYSVMGKTIPEYLKGNIEHKRNLYNEGEPKLMPIPNYNGEHIDWILWFHSEAVRDHLSPQMMNYVKVEELHAFSSNLAYRAFSKLVECCHGVKTAIIGGQAPVSKLLYNYHTPTFIIEDWRSEIVGYQLPYVYTISRLDMVENSFDSKEDKIRIMDNHRKVYDAMMNKELFFDYCHPGKPHVLLAEKLHNIFQTL